MTNDRVPTDENSLRALSERISEVLTGAAKDGPPPLPQEVTLRHIAEFCWALGVEPRLEFWQTTSVEIPVENA